MKCQLGLSLRAYSDHRRGLTRGWSSVARQIETYYAMESRNDTHEQEERHKLRGDDLHRRLER